MNIANYLGVQDLHTPTMTEARHRWNDWCGTEPALAVVTELDDLPEWSWTRDPRTDDVLRALVRLGSLHGEPLATTVLCWLLVPGAGEIARQHQHLSPAVDEITAGALWLAASEVDWTRPTQILPSVLRATRRALQAELGIGEGAHRRDRAWAAARPWGPSAAGWTYIFERRSAAPSAAVELLNLLEEAIADEVITAADRDLLLDIAVVTDVHELEDATPAPARREACGLGNRAAAAAVSRRLGVSERTVRRRLHRCIVDLSAYAAGGSQNLTLA